ncbi:hypothetical protein HOD38_00725 [archaeon]|jgi:hypothetical protein|nr:hypothetical protein [archaeon]MBT4396769.1 hypothetical protein [archaeon]MBT4441379.1 hypothetical protein [archaeon]
MNEPTITYGVFEQPLHTNGQYLLMEADIGNREYSTTDFIAAIEGVDVSRVLTGEGRRDVGNQRMVLKTMARMADTVTIANFEPDRVALERFVNTTFAQMRAEMERSR